MKFGNDRRIEERGDFLQEENLVECKNYFEKINYVKDKFVEFDSNYLRSNYVSSRVDSLVSMEPIIVDLTNKISGLDEEKIDSKVSSLDVQKLRKRKENLVRDKEKLVCEVQDYAYDVFVSYLNDEFRWKALEIINEAERLNGESKKIVRNLKENINVMYEKVKVFANLEDTMEIEKTFELICKYSDVILKDLKFLVKFF
ncbi:MAG: hypothetical protein KC589_01820 [Nanoarchaeota archaeon]|nr:hypothetical protein [Nanoarchaeota archaeon]